LKERYKEVQRWWEDEEEYVAATGYPSGNKRVLEIETGRNRSHSLENSPWKKLWTCHKTIYVMVM
jgi:hypothetical protein